VEIDMKYEKTKSDLLIDLKEQMTFIRNSSLLYDKGYINEAKNLALRIRILVYDNPKTNSRSLLGLLKVKDKLEYYNKIPADVDNSKCFMGIGMSMSNRGLKFGPMLTPPERKCSFDEWWNSIFLKDADSTIRRNYIIRSVVHMDGGAHIDPKLDKIFSNKKIFNPLLTFKYVNSIFIKGLNYSLIGDMDNALITYDIVLEKLKLIKGIEPYKIKFATYNNIVTHRMKDEMYDETIKICNEVLESLHEVGINKDNIWKYNDYVNNLGENDGTLLAKQLAKCLCNKSTAYFKLQNYAAATKIYEEFSNIFSNTNNVEINNYLIQLKAVLGIS
jgi:tetratricopeptide (TPR) repeat protein